MSRSKDDHTEQTESPTDDQFTTSRRRFVTIAGAGLVSSAIGVGRAGAQETTGEASTADVQYDHLPMDGESVLDHYAGFVAGHGDANWALDDTQAASGNQSLKGRIDAGESWGSNVQWSLEAAGYPPNVDEWHQRFRFRLAEDFEMGADDNCRIFNAALADGSSNSGGGGTPSGDDGWSERLYVTDRGSRAEGTWNLLSYTYHMDQDGTYGDQSVIDDVELRPGEWHRIDCYCRANSVADGSATEDGVVRYWLDGQQVHEQTGLRFTTADDNRIQWGGPVLHYGGSYTAPSDVVVWYDDHEIWLTEHASY